MDSITLLQTWIDAFQARDVGRVVACYAEDAVNFQVAAGKPSVGMEEIRNDTANFFTAFPDAWSRVESLFGDGDRAAWEWIGGGTFLGEFAGIEPTGRSFEIRGCGFFTFRNGLIVYQRGYWDKHSWFTQIGIPIE
ncbi:MAG: ester cyclase [Acidobacteria bacterium]|nr:ester cyclase [Acidobacteriota bacterium]